MNDDLSVFKNQGMTTVDFIGVVIVFPLLYLQLTLGAIYWYMKSNHLEEISDFIAYPILALGFVPAGLTIWNFIAGIAVDVEKRMVTAPWFMIFRRTIPLDDVKSWKRRDVEYTRASQFRPQFRTWWKHLVVFRMKNGAERSVVFRDKKTREAFLGTLADLISS